MDAVEAIEASFKELLKEKPYAKISVSELCERAGVSRKTFYVRFRDKEAIVEDLFERHVIAPLRSLNTVLSKDRARLFDRLFYEKMYEAIYEEREYYIALIGPMRGVDDTFIRVVTNAIYDFNMDLIPRISVIGGTWQADYVAYFFASSQAMLMQKWISDKMAVSPQDLAELYGKMTASFWQSLV